MSFKIGNIQIDNPVVVAPMAGISNSAFRVTVKEFGAGLVVCEMISDKGIQFRNEKTLSMLHIEPNEYPLSVQIMGGNKDTLVEAAKYVAENTEAAIIDINMGCPVNKVIKAEAGAKWLLDPNKVYEMVAAVVDAVDKPVTVKMRTGWDDSEFVAPELARRCEAAGAAALAVHGRTREQFYSGRADLEKIAAVVKAVSIPVIGNGDITDGPSCARMFEKTGCTAVMIGRGAQGNPWIFEEVRDYLSGKTVQKPSAADRYAVLLEHFESLIRFKGAHIALREMRSHASWYTKGLFGSAALRERINRTSTVEEFRQVISEVAKCTV